MLANNQMTTYNKIENIIRNAFLRQFFESLWISNITLAPPSGRRRELLSALRASRWPRIILLIPFRRVREFRILQTHNSREKILSFLALKMFVFVFEPAEAAHLQAGLGPGDWQTWDQNLLTFGDFSHRSDSFLSAQLRDAPDLPSLFWRQTPTATGVLSPTTTE